MSNPPTLPISPIQEVLYDVYLVENILNWLPIKDKIKLMSVNKIWKNAGEASLRTQTQIIICGPPEWMDWNLWDHGHSDSPHALIYRKDIPIKFWEDIFSMLTNVRKVTIGHLVSPTSEETMSLLSLMFASMPIETFYAENVHLISGWPFQSTHLRDFKLGYSSYCIGPINKEQVHATFEGLVRQSPSIKRIACMLNEDHWGILPDGLEYIQYLPNFTMRPEFVSCQDLLHLSRSGASTTIQVIDDMVAIRVSEFSHLPVRCVFPKMTTLSLDLLDWNVDNMDTDSAIDRLCTFLKTLPELQTLNIHIGVMWTVICGPPGSPSKIESAKLTTLLAKLNGCGMCHLLKSAKFLIEKFSSDVFAQLVEFASIETLDVYICSSELPPLEDIVTFLQRMPSLSYFRIEATEYSKSEANKQTKVKTKIPLWLIELSRSEEFKVDLDIDSGLTALPLDPTVMVQSRPPGYLEVRKHIKEVVPIFVPGYQNIVMGDDDSDD